MSKNYNEIRKEEVQSSDYNFLIVTATDTETKAFHELMPESISQVISNSITYYLGQVGQYNIIHIQCQQMGSISPGGSTLTIHKALQEWPSIKAVIMIGICFGIDDSKQHIGDVVISSSISNYETRRIGKDKELARGETYHSDRCLLNAFNNLKRSWENIGSDGNIKELIIGEYVSGEKLVDNIEFRTKLLSEKPEAKAGEMEGNGLVAACVAESIPWILVKSICDFGDGNKGKDKKTKQAMAASSSAECCVAVLEQSTAFESIGIKTVCEKDTTISELINEDVLFELYKKEYAPYFVHREIDTLVESYLQSHSLWIYGESGTGKSTSIFHALLSTDKNILLINMAGMSPSSSIEDIFQWIYNDIADIVQEKSVVPHPYQLCIKAIISMLDKHYAGQQVYVLVEEIPFEGDYFKTFVNVFSSLVISDKLAGNSSDVHFVLSSIDNPVNFITPVQQKVKSIVKFLEFGVWSNAECKKLIELIKKNLPFHHIPDQDLLITKCENLPRPIKIVFREAIHLGLTKDLDSNNIDKIISQL